MANCVKCGKPIGKGVKFCTSCGTVVSAGKAVTGGREKAARQPTAQSAAGKDAVVSTLGWLGTIILLIIPIVGLVVYFIWAFGKGNLNRRNYARASLILMAVGIILGVVFVVFLLPMFQDFIRLCMGFIEETGWFKF